MPVSPVLEEPAVEGREGREPGQRVALVRGELLVGPWLRVGIRHASA